MVCQQVRDMLKSNAAITLPMKKMISRVVDLVKNEAIA
jgi:hypothetical protein